MKKFLAILCASFVAIALLSGCATSFKTTNGALSYGKIKGADKGTFKAVGPAHYIISPYLIPLQKTNEKLDTIIDPELKKLGANAATKVEIKYGFDLMEFIITDITGGLYGMMHVEVTGNAIAQ